MHPRLSVSENYMFNKSIFYDTDFGGIISFLDFEEIDVFAHEVCDGSVRTVSPSHTEVRVFQVFV